MKQIKILGLTALLLAIGVSCKKLDFNYLYAPATDNWYNTPEQVEMSVNDLFRAAFWPKPYWEWCDDHLKRLETNFITGGTINSETSNVATIWTNAYKAIARANTILRALENAEERGFTKEKAELYRGLMLFVRAGQYGMLTTYFGDVVYYEGVLTVEESWVIGRTSREDIMQNVYRDFDLAAEYLPATIEGADAYRATKSAAYAMKARYALYNEDWEVAADAAQACMDEDVHELHPSFSEYFLPSSTNNVESIFLFPRSVEYSVSFSTRNYLPRTRCNGYAWETPSWDLLCSFYCTDGLPIDESPLFDPRNPFKNRDPRCAMTIVEFNTEHLGVEYDPHPNRVKVPNYLTGAEVANLDSKAGTEHASYNGLLIKKGTDETWYNEGTWRSEQDLVIIRYADVLLMYAEAKIEMNEIDQSVLDAINQVRARAYEVDYTADTGYPKVTTTDQDELRKIVRIERRMEFAFEGTRYWDIIRWRIAEIALNKPNYGLLDLKELKDNVVAKNLWFFPETPQLDEHGIADFEPMYRKGLIKLLAQRQFDADRQYLFPIPSDEVTSNPNLGQNDNY